MKRRVFNSCSPSTGGEEEEDKKMREEEEEEEEEERDGALERESAELLSRLNERERERTRERKRKRPLASPQEKKERNARELFRFSFFSFFTSTLCRP